MSSENNRVRFHMGCGERLQSRRRVLRCIGAASRGGMKGAGGAARRTRGAGDKS